ncbi:hypothetical protein INT45_006159 [Circinella minor]|uniref:ZNF380 coiled-coil domain-containing protein n=1 Tax=Circinella minor TaxID=1195481 RepID=A0A8H7VEK4_9FUNG|nr:hypothetical protein INT45_006159 [Circinella minor]
MPKTEIRKLLKQQRSERQKEKRVEHPFAKYDAQDQLICVVCQSQVKSVWSTHLTSAYHKENMARLRSLKQQKQQQQQKRPVKRTSSPVLEETSVKRAKHHETHNVDDVEQDEEMENDNDTSQQLPADFFDNSSSKQHISDEEENEDEEDKKKEEEKQFKPSSQPRKQEPKKPEQQPGRGAGSNLPQGFFDDPEEEARIRNKAPIAEQVENILDEEYSLFKEAMADTIIESEKVDEEEDEELWLDRDEEMFRQQAEFDSRVEHLKKMRVQGISATTKERVDYDDDDMEQEMKNGLKKGVRNVLKKAPSKKITTVFDDMDISSDDEEEEEDDDWRAQQL